MAGGRRKLTARAAAATKPGRYGDGGGLYLVVGPTGSRKWVYRFSWNGRVTETGLGSAHDVSLAEARDAAAERRKLVKAGINPIEARRKAVQQAIGVPAFGEIADSYIASKSSEWRNAKHAAQWRMTLESYAAPLRSLPVDKIGTEEILSVLQPIWQGKPETASRLRGRLEHVLDAAKAKGYRVGENPARWRGHLDKLLPKRQKLSRGHFDAMAYADVPAFMKRLRAREGMAALALEFLVLTACRSGEVFGTRWSEIDLETAIWTIPAARTKPGREHRVPLSKPAMAILRKLGEARMGDLVFPGKRTDKQLSAMAMAMVLRRMKVQGATVHGFRSSFRDWAGDETPFAREVAEAELAHVIGDKAEQAYRRGDALEKRRQLMEAWAEYCSGVGDGKVIRFSVRGRA